MKRNKKIKIILIIAIILLAIFFAIVISNAVKIKTTAITTAEIEKFTRNIKFSKDTKRMPYMEFNGKTENVGVLSISDDGREIIFETPLFENVGDKAILHYWIKNDNVEEAKIGELICKTTLVDDEKSSIEKEVNDESNEIKTENIETTEETEIDSYLNEDIDEYISITSRDELKNTTISGGKTTISDGTIEIELLKPYRGPKENLTYRITCHVEVTRE